MTGRLDVVFCDDIRQELGNKQSLMGVYHGDMIVSVFPAKLPKFAMAVALHLRASNFNSIDLLARLDDVEIAKVEVRPGQVSGAAELAIPELAGDSSNKFFTVRFAVFVAPLEIQRPCVLHVTADVDGEKLATRPLRIIGPPGIVVPSVSIAP